MDRKHESTRYSSIPNGHVVWVCASREKTLGIQAPLILDYFSSPLGSIQMRHRQAGSKAPSKHVHVSAWTCKSLTSNTTREFVKKHHRTPRNEAKHQRFHTRKLTFISRESRAHAISSAARMTDTYDYAPKVLRGCLLPCCPPRTCCTP